MPSRSYPFCWVGHSTLTPWYLNCSYSPETQLPLKRKGVNSCPRMSCSLKRWPLTLGPSSGGVSSTTDVTINASTMTMTSNAIRIPRQLRWLGLLDTNCWHKGKSIMQVSVVTDSVGGFLLKCIWQLLVSEEEVWEAGNWHCLQVWDYIPSASDTVVLDVSTHRVYTSHNPFSVRSAWYYRRVEGNL